MVNDQLKVAAHVETATDVLYQTYLRISSKIAYKI